MAENTNPETTGYSTEGRADEAQVVEGATPMTIPDEPVKAVADDEVAGFALQAETLSDGEPARVAPAPAAPSPADADERAGAQLQQQELAPQEPVAANPAAAGYTTQGRQLEQQAVTPGAPTSFPTEPVAPYAAPAPAPAPSHTAAQQAYQAAYGAPVNQGTRPYAAAPQAGTYNPHAAATAAAYQKTRSDVNPRRVFLICGLVVGALMVLFGLCMLAFHTPNVMVQAMDTFQLGQDAYAATGATSQEILKTGFSLLLIGLGGTNICAFGAKLFDKKN